MGAIVRQASPARLSNGYSTARARRRRLLRRGRSDFAHAVAAHRSRGGARVRRRGARGRSAGGVVIVGARRRRQDAARGRGRGARGGAGLRGGMGAGDPLGAGDPARRLRGAAARSPQAGPPEGVELLALARQTLAERAAGRRLVLCVDDGQLLDDASAALVHQLVAAGEASRR